MPHWYVGCESNLHALIIAALHKDEQSAPYSNSFTQEIIPGSNRYYKPWGCMCSPRYPACTAHAPYYIVACGLPGLYNIFPHFLITERFSKKKVTEHKMCVFFFSTNFARNNYRFKNNSAIFDQKYTLVCMGGTRYCCRILMENKLSGQMFAKDPHIKFHENSSSGSRVVPCGRTDKETDRETDWLNDWHEEANSRFSRFLRRRQTTGCHCLLI